VEIAREDGWKLGGEGGTDAYDLTLDDAAGLAGMVKQALESEKTVDTLPADKAGRVEKLDTEHLVGDIQDSKVGQVLGGKYEIRSKLGEGGMGAVYLVRHKDLKQDFALKLLHPHIASNDSFRERFLREAKAATAFTHKHAIQIRDFGHDGEALYMTMDFSRGRSLKAILEKDGALPEVRTAKITHQVLLALREAHAAGLIHRDLKPENIMIESRKNDDFVRILDFGIAKIVGDAQETADTQAPTLTRTGTVVGTVQYMSPEQAAGDPDIDARSDLYSLATIMYECVTGKRHIEAANMQQMMFKLATEDPVPLSNHVKGVSKKLEKLIMKNLSRERGKRSSDAVEFLAELEAFSAFLQSTVAIRRSGVPLAVPIVIGSVAAIAAVVLLLLLKPWDKGPEGPGPDFGPTAAQTLEAQEKEFGRLKGLGDQAREKGDFASAKEHYLEAQEQRDKEEIRSLIKECRFKLFFAAYEKARAEKDFNEALTQILLAKENPSSGREKLQVDRIEKELTNILQTSQDLFASAKRLDDEKKHLLAMPEYAEYIREYPKGDHIQASRDRFAALEDLTRSFEGLLVKSEPVGAEVYLDGRPIGRTPVMEGGISRGTHTLRLELDGYKILESEVAWEGGRLVREETLVKEVFALLSVRSAGAQVDVSLDGRRKGSTPLKIEKVTPGKHVLEFTGPGNISYSLEVNVEGEGTIKVEVDFEEMVKKEEAEFKALPRGKALEDTRAIYRGFEGKYPKGKFTQLARKVVTDLDELAREYRAIEAETDDARKLKASETFLYRHQGEVYPRGWYVGEARQIRDGIQKKMEEEAFGAIAVETTFNGRNRALEAYRSRFPRGAHISQVDAMIRALDREETHYMRFYRDDRFGEKLAAGRSYVGEYPEGLKIEEVKKTVASLEKSEQEAFEVFRAEKDLVKRIQAGKHFASEFPGSEHEAEVKKARALAENEKKAFDRTADDAEACLEYLKKYPEGYLREAVDTRYGRFGWTEGDGLAVFTGKLPKTLKRGGAPGEYVNEWDGTVMVFVPAGFFPLGTDDFFAEDEDGPEIMVYMSAYFIDKYEVSNEQFGKFLAWRKGASNPGKFDHPETPGGFDPSPAFLNDPNFNRPDQPVVGVDWLGAWAYARWAGKSLPTEAQWEKASSSDTVMRVKSKHPWGAKAPTDSLCAFGGKSVKPFSVSEFASGRSPFGALNMAGNVSEWCLDAFDSGFYARLMEEYPKEKNRWAVNPFNEGLADGPHSVRGGSWEDDEEDLVVTRRENLENQDKRTGFRCAVWHVAKK